MHAIGRPRRLLAIALTALAGFVDAAGFLAADRYFVSFMSGNTTRLGVELARSPHLAWLPGLLIAAFVGGVAIGAIVARRAGTRRKPAVLALVAALLALAALLRGMEAVAAMLTLLAMAMGALNNTFQRDGTVSVGLTYMTGALVRLGQNLATRLTGGDNGQGWEGWLLLWLGLVVGATGGALAWTWLPALALWLAAGWTALLALAARRFPAE